MQVSLSGVQRHLARSQIVQKTVGQPYGTVLRQAYSFAGGPLLQRERAFNAHVIAEVVCMGVEKGKLEVLR